MSHSSDFVVVGSGVFGVWIAQCLRQRKFSVTLLDAYGAGNSRSSSGDESRVIRMGYGADALYTRWANRSLALWQEFSSANGIELFVKTGMLWLAAHDDTSVSATLETLTAERIDHEKLTASEIERRFPQFNLDNVEFGIFEPQSGVLLARRAVMAVRDAMRLGVNYRVDAALVPAHASGTGSLSSLPLRSGESLSAGTFVFACGAWLPQLLPELLGTRIFPTRQEVFYFGTPAGSREFLPGAMPTWLHRCDDMYGLPDIEGRGIKIASDRHGGEANPEMENRVASSDARIDVTEYLGRRLPALKNAPIVESRVCQYENTWNGDFLIDCHPEWNNVWIAGGGSGHGFKHGPMVGEYLSARMLNEIQPEPRFSLASKEQVQQRSVY